MITSSLSTGASHALPRLWQLLVFEICKIVRPLAVLFSSDLCDISDNTGMDPLSDAQLAQRAKHDLTCFAELYERFFQRVYRYFYTRLRYRPDAEDLTSDTFHKILTKLHTFHDRGLPFGAWVFKIAHNCFVDHVRAKNPAPESIDDLVPGDEPFADFDLHDIDQKLLTEKLWAIVATLPPKQQEVWSLKLASDLPHKQIAEVLGLSESNVNVILHRSIHTFKDRMQHLPPDTDL